MVGVADLVELVALTWLIISVHCLSFRIIPPPPWLDGCLIIFRLRQFFKKLLIDSVTTGGDQTLLHRRLNLTIGLVQVGTVVELAA